MEKFVLSIFACLLLVAMVLVFQEKSYAEMPLDFQEFCKSYDIANWDYMKPNERMAGQICSFQRIGFNQTHWAWLNGTSVDFSNFAKNASESYARNIPKYAKSGINGTLSVDSYASGLESLPPPMGATISFDYMAGSTVAHYKEKFTVCIDGKLLPWENQYVNCSDEFVKYDLTQSAPPTIPLFIKKEPLPSNLRKTMMDWCTFLPRSSSEDFWGVVPVRILQTIPEFESLDGMPYSVVVNSYASEESCPPRVWMMGTFASANGDEHAFSLYYDKDSLRYNIDEIECKEGLSLVKKSSDDSLACVRPETKQRLIEWDWAKESTGFVTIEPQIGKSGSYSLDYDGSTYDIRYSIEGAAISSIQKKSDAALDISLEPYHDGSLSVIIPTELIGNKTRGWDGTPIVFIDGLEVKFDDNSTGEDYKTLTIPITKNSGQIKIVSTYPLSGVAHSLAGAVPVKNVDWKRYITVTASRINDFDKSGIQQIQHIGDVQNIMVYNLLNGADGCRDKTEVCTMPKGVSLLGFMPYGIRITDSDEYSVSITHAQADYILSVLDWVEQDGLMYDVVSRDGNYYFLQLSTSDDLGTPDVAMSIDDVPNTPVQLDRDVILSFPIEIRTWATHGGPAQIDLAATQSAKDSGVRVWIEPDTLVVKERSNATANLSVAAKADAKVGIYGIRVVGKANGNNAGLHCGNTSCPYVEVGRSDWTITTYGTGGGTSLGGTSPPGNARAEIVLNKDEFFEGDTAEIKAYLVNDGAEPMALDPEMELVIKVIRADSHGYYDHFYEIDAIKDSGESIVLEPNSKTLLARPFYWNQETFETLLGEEHRIEPGDRMITMDVVAGNYSWSAERGITIR